MFLLGIIAVLVVVLLRQPQPQPRFTLLRGIVRALTLVLFAEEPPAGPSVPEIDGYQESLPEIGAPPVEGDHGDGYASVNHGSGW